jgi:hypothetical protein
MRACSARRLQAIRKRTVFVIPAFDVRRGVERTAWADALVSGDKVWAWQHKWSETCCEYPAHARTHTSAYSHTRINITPFTHTRCRRPWCMP